MTLPRQAVFHAAWLAALARWRFEPWPAAGELPALDLVAALDPGFHAVLRVWHAVGPGVAVLLGGSLVLSLWDVWGPRWGGGSARGALPPWPQAAEDDPVLVIGEQHHPVEPVESARPTWLTIPAKGLFTGIAIFGAVGTGKTSACMRPFAEQILGWRADDPGRRAGGLVLEVKGDFCAQIETVMQEAGRGDDYVALGLGGKWSWNPLDVPEMDSYSLAYQVAALLNQLFGKGKEPFWQQASTSLLRWTIELHRLPPLDGWVTLRDLYHVAIDPIRFAELIDEACEAAGAPSALRAVIPSEAIIELPEEIGGWGWQAEDGGRLSVPASAERLAALKKAGCVPDLVEPQIRGGDDAKRAESLRTWFEKDWMGMEGKLRTSIVEGISSFLGIFDDPAVAEIFCPAVPADGDAGGDIRPLPQLRQMIESGKVIALAMPASRNPALSRAVGTMLKTAWLQAALGRPADMAAPGSEGRYWRPSLFLCDEYQSFATVGEDDPAGDEKAFAMTRQARVIPIVATQSIASLKSVTRGGEAWKTLLQCFRTRIFCALSDTDSTKLAAEMCGQAERIKASYSVSESGGRGGVSPLSGELTASRGGVGASKTYSSRREAVFEATLFGLLDTCQAIVVPFDGLRAGGARRVYLKPWFLPRSLPYWRAREKGKL